MAIVNWSIQHKRGDAATWASVNPILLAGQIGIELHTDPNDNKMKVGIGLTWSNTPYISGSVSVDFSAITGAARDNADLNSELEAIDITLGIHDAVLQALATEVARKKNRVSELDSGGDINVVTDDVTIDPATWFILNSPSSLYEKLTPTQFNNIVLSGAGLNRYVGFFGTTLSTIVMVDGTESQYAKIPDTPADTAPIGYILVSDSGVGAADPDLLNYLLIASKAAAGDVVTGTNDSLYITSYGLKGAKDASSGYVGLTGRKINIYNLLGTLLSTIENSNTGVRAYVMPDASGTMVLNDNTATLTNKRITKRVTSITSSSTPTPNADTDDQLNITALGTAATIQNPTGTPTSGQLLMIRIKDNTVARALSFDTQYRFSSELSAPTTTISSKTLYMLFERNGADSRWDCLSWLNNF